MTARSKKEDWEQDSDESRLGTEFEEQTRLHLTSQLSVLPEDQSCVVLPSHVIYPEMRTHPNRKVRGLLGREFCDLIIVRERDLERLEDPDQEDPEILFVECTSRFPRHVDRGSFVFHDGKRFNARTSLFAFGDVGGPCHLIAKDRVRKLRPRMMGDETFVDDTRLKEQHEPAITWLRRVGFI